MPFYAVPGNHDGSETEASEDTQVYLDNFFFPSAGESGIATAYRFQFADLAEFYALDSTQNGPNETTTPNYLENGPQFTWMKKALPKITAAVYDAPDGNIPLPMEWPANENLRGGFRFGCLCFEFDLVSSRAYSLASTVMRRPRKFGLRSRSLESRKFSNQKADL